VSYAHSSVMRVFVVFSLMFVAQTVLAGMPQFPVKPLPRQASPARFSIQPASSTTSEPKSDPYRDFNDGHGEVFAMTLSGPGSKRISHRTGSHPDSETDLICAVVLAGAGSYPLQMFFPSDPPGSRLGVLLRC